MRRTNTDTLLLVAAIALATSATTRAQSPTLAPAPPTQDELRQLRTTKLARPVFQKATWLTDYDAALALAKQGDKALLVYFTRSWSPSKESDAFENGPLANPAFHDLAKDFVLFLHCASRVADEPRPRLLHELGLAVVPMVAFLDGDGKLIVQQRELALGAIVGAGQRAKALVDARAAVRKGEADAAKRLFLAELDLDLMNPDQIRSRIDSARLDTAERARIDPQIVDAEIVAAARQIGSLGRKEVAQRVGAMHAAGRQPTERYAFSFWSWLLAHAAIAKDGTLADAAIAEMVRRQDPNEDPQTTIRNREEWERLRAEAKGK